MQNDRDRVAIVDWHALSLKRVAHFDELKRTGRWKLHFLTEEAFDQALRRANDDAERWKELVNRSGVASQ